MVVLGGVSHDSLCCSGSSEVYILARENAVEVWRKLMGPTKVFRAQFIAPMSIRGSFGLSDTRNAVHGSGELDGQSCTYMYPCTDLTSYLMLSPASGFQILLSQHPER